MFDLLRVHPNFRWLWTAQLVSLIGDGISRWSMVNWIFQVSGGSPLIQSLSFVVTIAPSLLLAPFAGVLVDRWDRRRVMIAADTVRGILSLLLILAVVSKQIGAALAISFLHACVASFFNPARGALLPHTVPPDQLVQANSLGQTTHSLMMLAGPTVGTLILAMMGPASAFGFDAATFFLSALCVSMVRVTSAPAAGRTAGRFTTDLRDGIRYAFQSQPIRVLMLSLIVMFAGAGTISGMGILVVRQLLGLPQSALVYPSTINPLTMTIASIVIGTTARRMQRVPLLISAGLAFGAVGIGLWAGATALPMVIGGAVLIGLCNALINIGLSTTLQRLVPDAMRGRVMSTVNALPNAAMLAASAAAGVMAEVVGVRWVVGASALFMAAASLVAYFGFRETRLPQLSNQVPAAGSRV